MLPVKSLKSLHQFSRRGCRHRLELCRCITYYKRGQAEKPLPRITMPQKMILKLEKKQEQAFQKKVKGKRTSPKGPLVIACARKDYNFYQGEKFDEKDSSLVSSGWKNTKRLGDYFTLVPHQKNPSLVDEEERVSFSDLGIGQDLCTGLDELGYEVPTEIQKLAIPSLLQGNNAVCAAETGSGKTLAYLLPCIEWITRCKEAQPEENQDSTNRPNTIILTPNRELCSQVMSVAEMFRPYADFVPHCLLGKSTSEERSLSPVTPMDLLVTSPGRLKQLLRKKLINASKLQHVVIDESDTLLDDSFSADIQKIFFNMKIVAAEQSGGDKPQMLGTQLVLVSATMSRDVSSCLKSFISINDMHKIKTKGLHHIMPHVPQKFIRVNPDSKPERLVQLLKTNEDKNRPTLVFTKDNKTCYYVSKMCEEMNINSLSLRGNMATEERNGVLDKFKEGYSNILIATDIASRGLDTVNVCHVINYDFPQEMSDYIHRVGRVGRVGSKQNGNVTSFVAHKWDVDLLWKIETSARKTGELSHVDANIKRKLSSRRRKGDSWEVNVS